MNRLQKVEMNQAFFFLKHGFLKTQLQRSSLRSVYSINLTVVLLSFLVANGCCGKQCSQGQIRAEGSSFLLQTHAHRLQVSTFVNRRAQNHKWWCAECHHLPCLLSNIASQTFTVPCLLQHRGLFKNVNTMDLVPSRPLQCVDLTFGMVLEYFGNLCKTKLRYNIVRNYNACDHCS